MKTVTLALFMRASPLHVLALSATLMAGFFIATPSSEPPLRSLAPLAFAQTLPAAPAVPNTSDAPSAGAAAAVDPSNRTPAQLIIPSIGLRDAIVPVGLTPGGAMAVPSGKTSNVGWYRGGPVPGEIGTAVLDAHIFAAFSKLHDVQVGDDIYVVTGGGQRLHFVVATARTYALNGLDPNVLFGSDGTARLNLITCAGKLTPDRSTYDRRLIVSAKLVG